MPAAPFSFDELKLALERVRRDHQNRRVFVTNCVEEALLREGEKEWLQSLETDLSAGSFSPSAAPVTEVPKAGGTARPGPMLSLRDQVVYVACVGKVLGPIRATMTWPDGPRDCAYQIADVTSSAWLRRPYLCWTEFRTRSLHALDAGAAYMIKTDITGYYDFIAIELLISDLRAIGAGTAITDLLVRCLQRWGIINWRGIPQGHSASDILGKFYLHRVDRALAESGFIHLRYVDDIRIFCASRAAAKKALLELGRLLRQRGLSIQTAKTAIQIPAEARATIDGVIPTLKPLAKKYIADIAALAGVDPYDLTPFDAEQLLDKNDLVPPTELLQAAYKSNFIDQGHRFDKTLFHYILARLGAAKDSYATNHVLTLLTEYPEETDPILEYYGKTRSVVDAEPELLLFIESKEAFYPYQHYPVIRWRMIFDEQPTPDFLAYVRKVSQSERTPHYLLSASRLFLGKFGTEPDLDRLIDSYPDAQSDSERAEILCCLHRMEKGRRNAFLGRARADGFFAGHAVNLVREERGPSIWA